MSDTTTSLQMTQPSGLTSPQFHQQVMQKADALLATAGVSIKGKLYLMVKDRLNLVRQGWGSDVGINTELLFADDTIVRVHATITDRTGRIIGSGLAEELRGSGVNKSSALENCETSAIGRALASLGLHGGEYASADELLANQRGDKIVDAKPKSAPIVEAKEKPKTEAEPVLGDTVWEKWTVDQLQGFHDYTTVDDLEFWYGTQDGSLLTLKAEKPHLFKQIIDALKDRKKTILAGEGA